MLNRTITRSKKIRKIGDRERFVFCLVNANADRDGLLPADPEDLWLLCEVGFLYSPEEFGESIDALIAVGLLEYIEDAKPTSCLFVSGFHDNQPNLNYRREAFSRWQLPKDERVARGMPPDLDRSGLARPDKGATQSRPSPDTVKTRSGQRRGEGEGEGEREREGEGPPAATNLSTDQKSTTWVPENLQDVSEAVADLAKLLILPEQDDRVRKLALTARFGARAVGFGDDPRGRTTTFSPDWPGRVHSSAPRIIASEIRFPTCALIVSSSKTRSAQILHSRATASIIRFRVCVRTNLVNSGLVLIRRSMRSTSSSSTPKHSRRSSRKLTGLDSPRLRSP